MPFVEVDYEENERLLEELITNYPEARDAYERITEGGKDK